MLRHHRIDGRLNGIHLQNPYNRENSDKILYRTRASTNRLMSDLELSTIQFAEKIKPPPPQEGSGILENAKLNFQTVASILTSGYGSERSTKLKNHWNTVRNNNPDWRPEYAGERHFPHRSGSTYNFMGPGTQIVKRIARGDPPLDGVNGLDAQARKHDIAYYNAKSLKDVRKADKDMLAGVKSANAPSVEKNIIAKGLKVKMFAEDKGIISANRYAKLQEPREYDHIGSGIIAKHNNQYPDDQVRKKLTQQYKNAVKKTKLL